MTGAPLGGVLIATGFDKLDRYVQRTSAFITIADDGAPPQPSPVDMYAGNLDFKGWI